MSETYPGGFDEVGFGLNVQLIGYTHMAIGRGSTIGDNSWLNVCDRSGGQRLLIGRNVCVGRNAMINAADRVEIGDFNLFAPRIYISDVDHEYADITRPVIEQGLRRRGALTIEENCWVGINCVISGGLTVGRGSVIAANSVVLDDIPPFCVVAGNPARIIKAYDPESRAWRRVDDPSRLPERETASLPDRESYRRLLEERRTLDILPPVIAGGGVHMP